MPELSDDERAVLGRLSDLLRRFGVANDAEDHAAAEEAAELRASGVAGIRELMRDHPLVAARLPGLEAELERGRLEAVWSRFADTVDGLLQTVRPEAIPWDRVHSFRGRATRVPDWIAQLWDASHAEALRRLDEALLAGDRITQATPLALRMILGAVRFGLVRDPAAALALAERIGAAARAEIAARGPAPHRVTLADWWPFREERLWPPAVDPRPDETLASGWQATDEDVRGWAALTLLVLDEHARFAAAGAAG